MACGLKEEEEKKIIRRCILKSESLGSFTKIGLWPKKGRRKKDNQKMRFEVGKLGLVPQLTGADFMIFLTSI